MEEESYIIKDHPFGDNGDLMTLEDWRESVEDGMFIDDDGFGDEVRWVDGEDPKVLEEWIYPSEADRLNPETTHILWYNK